LVHELVSEVKTYSMHIAICAATENQPEKNLAAAEFFYLSVFSAD